MFVENYENYDLNVLLIMVIVAIMFAIAAFYLIESVINFNKKPVGFAVPSGTPNLSYDSNKDLDVPTFKRKGVTLSCDNYKIPASA